MIRAALVAAMLAGAPTAYAADFLAIGDSYTIGESVPASARWPNALVRALRASGVEIGDAQIIARTGWTTDELLRALGAIERGKSIQLADGEVAQKPVPPYRLVSVLIGVNNQYRGRPVGEFAADLETILDKADAYAGGEAQRVIVLSIPDWGVTPFAKEKGSDAASTATAIDAYNAAVERAATARGMAFVDITPFTREAGADSSLLADDGLHPSAKDYERWAQRALPAARRALGSAE